jgi:hypothetical protein
VRASPAAAQHTRLLPLTPSPARRRSRALAPRRYGDDLSQIDDLSVLSFKSTSPGGDHASALKMELELLRMENQRLENEVHATRLQAAVSERAIKERCSAAEQRAHSVEAAREKEQQRHEVELARERQKHAQEMSETIRSRKHEFQQEEDIARERTAALRASFTPLELSVERYGDIKSQREDQLPFKEWLQLQVHERVMESAQQLEKSRCERDELQGALALCREELAQAQRGSEQVNATLVAREKTIAGDPHCPHSYYRPEHCRWILPGRRVQRTRVVQ